MTILRHDATTPSGCACHPSAGGELAVRYFFDSSMLFIQTRCNRPSVGLSKKYCYRSVEAIYVKMVGTQKTTPSGCACHPSAGGELALPQEGNGLPRQLNRRFYSAPTGCGGLKTGFLIPVACQFGVSRHQSALFVDHCQRCL